MENAEIILSKTVNVLIFSKERNRVSMVSTFYILRI